MAASYAARMIREFAMPPPLSERARQWLFGSADSVPVARPSATVLLVRDADVSGVASGDAAGGVELFLLHRHATMAFAGGMYVFPGGGVDPRDADPGLPWSGPPPEQWAAQLGSTATQARELVCAAVRETFEECGVLLAGPDDSTVVCDVSGEDWEADRQRLLSRDVALSELLQRRRLLLRSDLLRAWAHWTTPEFEPRRFDTRFFLAAVPGRQKARHVEDGEASESGWWPASQVLAGFEAGRLELLPPTLVGVEEVAAASRVSQLLAAGRRVRRVMPRVEVDRSGGEPVVRMLAELPG
jgi:8-oxo-dGTP pyrophosphatase MutT (NUDIX family)